MRSCGCDDSDTYRSSIAPSARYPLTSLLLLASPEAQEYPSMENRNVAASQLAQAERRRNRLAAAKINQIGISLPSSVCACAVDDSSPAINREIFDALFLVST